MFNSTATCKEEWRVQLAINRPHPSTLIGKNKQSTRTEKWKLIFSMRDIFLSVPLPIPCRHLSVPRTPCRINLNKLELKLNSTWQCIFNWALYPIESSSFKSTNSTTTCPTLSLPLLVQGRFFSRLSSDILTEGLHEFKILMNDIREMCLIVHSCLYLLLYSHEPPKLWTIAVVLFVMNRRPVRSTDRTWNNWPYTVRCTSIDPERRRELFVLLCRE